MPYFKHNFTEKEYLYGFDLYHLYRNSQLPIALLSQ